jgi:hypothetical protein
MMTKLTVQETTVLFHSYGLKCNQNTVEHWIAIEKLKGTKSGMSYIIDEKDAYEFLYDYRYEGTAYERGIDVQTKIHRLEQEISALNDEKEKLREIVLDLKIQLGIEPF